MPGEFKERDPQDPGTGDPQAHQWPGQGKWSSSGTFHPAACKYEDGVGGVRTTTAVPACTAGSGGPEMSGPWTLEDAKHSGVPCV